MHPYDEAWFSSQFGFTNFYEDWEVLKTKLLRSSIWLSRSSFLLKILSDAQSSSCRKWEEKVVHNLYIIPIIQNNLNFVCMFGNKELIQKWGGKNSSYLKKSLEKLHQKI